MDDALRRPDPKPPRCVGVRRLALSRLNGGLILAALVAVVGVFALRTAPLAMSPAAPNRTGYMAFQRHPDRAALSLAQRLDPGRRATLAGRPEGWAVLDLRAIPTLGLGALSQQEAERVNAWLPTFGGASAPASPFVLRAAGAERERAILCLTQAIYYEAALEPTPGQEAVAQAVLNRMRNPDFPKSICGVVYQGSSQVTGCQFSFTCDGSKDRPPIAPFWNRARQVAEQAVNGFVMAAVGTATHYHADYVFPRWGPTLVKIRQIGAHIFYRFPGPAGQPASFHAPYAGNELRVSMDGPSPEAILAAKGESTLAPLQTFAVVDPTAPGGLRPRVAGQIEFGRRAPTKDEIARINASLAGMEKASPAAPAPPLSDDAPIAHKSWAEQ